jgi:hypothetical protein
MTLIDTNWLKLKQERDLRAERVLEPTPLKINCVTRFWANRGEDVYEVEFDRGSIRFKSNPQKPYSGRIPDAWHIYQQLIADRQLSGDSYDIRYAVCRHPDISDSRVNVVEVNQRHMVTCWVWLTEHWQSGQEATRVWELTRLHVGRDVTQYRL